MIFNRFWEIILLSLKWTHSVVESAYTSLGLPDQVICYKLNVEKKKKKKKKKKTHRIIVTVKKKVRGTYYLCFSQRKIWQFGMKQNSENNWSHVGKFNKFWYICTCRSRVALSRTMSVYSSFLPSFVVSSHSAIYPGWKWNCNKCNIISHLIMMKMPILKSDYETFIVQYNDMEGVFD